MRFLARDLLAPLDGTLVVPDASAAPSGDPGAVVFDGVSIDSRAIAPGNLFVPIVAERDGHDFVAGAVGSGAGGYLVAHHVEDSALRQQGGVPATVPAIAVDDTEAALTAIGRLARSRLSGPVIGVTGSVGKTSMKDLIEAAVSGTRRAHASERSFNNELGVPLTLANAPDDTEVAVIEMGARGKGHIATLCAVAQPTIGVVTAVALAHSELFGSLQGVAEAKGELVEALDADGIAVLNVDDPNVAAMAAKAAGRVVTYGTGPVSPQAEFRAEHIELDELLQPSFRLVTPDGEFDVQLAVAGAHMAHNAAGAVAASWAAGVAVADAVAGLGAVALSPWRMEVVRTTNGLVVINDAYNANPTSMRAALTALIEVPAHDRFAVVGAMAELGDEGPGEHRAVASEAAAAGVTVIALNALDYGRDAVHVTSRDEARAVLGDLGEGSAVLVKGSRVAGLEVLAGQLIRDHSTAPVGDPA